MDSHVVGTGWMARSGILPTIFAALLLAPFGHVAAVQDYPFEQVAPRTWVIHGPLGMPNVANQGFMNNPAVIITRDGVVIVDPGSSRQAGEMVLRMLKRMTAQPVIAVFNTHIHGDHWLGNQAIREAWPDVPIYGHPNLLAGIEAGEGDSWVALMDRLTEGATRGTRVVGPNKPIDDGDVVTVGDVTFRIHHFGKAHTTSDIMIEAVQEGVVFLGDNVLAKRIPRMSDGDFKGNIAAIDQILVTPATVWVPGHGPTGDRAMVDEYRQYLQTVYRVAAQVYGEDKDSSEVKGPLLAATLQYRDWVGYDDEIARHGAQAFLEVEAAEF